MAVPEIEREICVRYVAGLLFCAGNFFVIKLKAESFQTACGVYRRLRPLQQAA
ncbi:hypothetical protein [Neisseria dentiae]|uniref:hypothetical protein n=1 Tax=Neisseria dentiae TaxID=194197 RepID=UPI0035A0E29F